MARFCIYKGMIDGHGVTVTLPTVAELDGRVILASDFAVACGVRFNIVEHNGERLFSAYTCSRTLYLGRDAEDGTDRNFIQAKTTQIKNGTLQDVHIAMNAGDHSLGFAPKILHPEVLGMRVVVPKNADIGMIKIGNKVPTQPQRYVGPRVSAKLERLFVAGELELRPGGTTVDLYSQYRCTRRDVKCDRVPVAETYPRYRLGNREYVRVYNQLPRPVRLSDGTPLEPFTAFWFACEPYRAVQNPDGSISCLTVLVPGQLECDSLFQSQINLALFGDRTQTRLMCGEKMMDLDVSKLKGGQYLARVFLPEMLASVGLDLTTTQAAEHGRTR